MAGYVTRFAPSPTGPLHLGHAFSALTAFDRATAVGGRFLLRIEDTDTDRSRPAWETQIYDDLQWLGLIWEEPVLRQSEQSARYSLALQYLAAKGLVYPCSCTRADIRAASSAPQEGAEPAHVYPGTCRSRPFDTRQTGDALRLNMAAALHASPWPQSFYESGEGSGLNEVCQKLLLQTHGDVVLARKDINMAAYVLASVIDDAAQGVTEILRGADMREITDVQVLLQHLLGLPTPVYHHHRLIRDDQGKRLAKRDDAKALSKFRTEGASPADIRRMVGL